MIFRHTHGNLRISIQVSFDEEVWDQDARAMRLEPVKPTLLLARLAAEGLRAEVEKACHEFARARRRQAEAVLRDRAAEAARLEAEPDDGAAAAKKAALVESLRKLLDPYVRLEGGAA